MDSTKTRLDTINAYIATFPDDIKAILEELRAIIRAAAPEATEKISYQMPAFALSGTLVYFAAWKGHIGFYPASSVAEAFGPELLAYECSKGAIRFPLDKPLPADLIGRIVQFRVAENRSRAEVTAGRRKAKQGGAL